MLKASTDQARARDLLQNFGPTRTRPRPPLHPAPAARFSLLRTVADAIPPFSVVLTAFVFGMVLLAGFGAFQPRHQDMVPPADTTARIVEPELPSEWDPAVEWNDDGTWTRDDDGCSCVYRAR